MGMNIQYLGADAAENASIDTPSSNASDAPAVGQTGDSLETRAPVVRGRKKTDLIGTVEFGDWLICEREPARAASRPGKSGMCSTALSRQASLKIAESVLYEFLTFQQKMLKNAAKARKR